MNHKFLRRLVLSMLVAAALTAIAVSGLLSRADNTMADLLYQRPQALEGNVVLIGIDERALEELGPFGTWGRGVLAQAIETLNADPDARPAVIGLDILFAGETDPEQDARLARAAAETGNVVAAASAQFGSQLVTQPDGSFYMDEHAVLGYDEPYPALKSATTQGHINAMFDADGILRHAIWQIELPDGSLVSSFHSQVYRMYAAQMGLDPDFAPPVDARQRWYVPLRALPGGYDDGFSVADLLAGDLPSDMFADKIVLIGPYAAGLQDSYQTAIDHAAPMYGVEFQANAIDALIAGDAKRELPLVPQAAALFVLCTICLLWFWDRRVLPAAAVWLGACALSVGVSILAFAWGLVLHPLYAPLLITVLFIACVAVNYTRAALDKRRVTSVFKRYVAPEIVSELLREDAQALGLGGKLTQIAVLFVDIRGFTSLSEALEPAQVVEILNRYLTLTTACVFQNGGTLDKFIGDCTMAFWGAPLPQEDCVYKAVRTALDMVQGAKALDEELAARFGRTVQFGIGVHFGPAIVGNIGAPERMDYTAIGDTVNTASRLESNAPGGTVLVSRAVADALNGRIPCVPLEHRIRLKGKTEAFEAFTVCEPATSNLGV